MRGLTSDSVLCCCVQHDSLQPFAESGCCSSCSAVLCTPTGGKARLTEGAHRSGLPKLCSVFLRLLLELCTTAVLA